MAAPTNAAKREESSCQLGAVHTWQIVLQKSFWTSDKNFSGPEARRSKEHEGDYIIL
jgi:hypothetical protein